jgi:hypothetical protein
MPQPRPVADYLDTLARALAFDPALACRARREAADHLHEASERDGGRCVEAERQAVAAFGDAHALARQYAATSLLTQTRCIGASTLAAITGIFIAMKCRVLWYELLQWGLPEDLRAMNAIGLPLDRWAFLGALAVALVACAYIATRRTATELHRAYGRELRRCVVLCTVAAAALTVVVAVETVLTGCRLYASQPSAAAIPALSLAAELVFAGALVLYIRTAFRRARCAATLLGD